jgi:undecaprenyl-diphosphatase
MLSFRQALILEILQAVSELFPISSLGHSIILPALLGWSIDQGANHFLTFLVATHFATAAVLFLRYHNDWARIIRGIVRSIWRGKLAEEPDAKMGWLLAVAQHPLITVNFRISARCASVTTHRGSCESACA